MDEKEIENRILELNGSTTIIVTRKQRMLEEKTKKSKEKFLNACPKVVKTKPLIISLNVLQKVEYL